MKKRFTLTAPKVFRILLTFLIFSPLSGFSRMIELPGDLAQRKASVAAIWRNRTEPLAAPLADTIKAYAQALHNKVVSENRILRAGQLSPNNVQDLPVGIGQKDPSGAGADILLIIDAMSVDATTGISTTQAYLVFDPPGGGANSEPIVFMADHVTMTAAGGLNSARLTLVGMEYVLVDGTIRVAIQSSQSGVNIDCNGFESFDIGGEVSFDKKLMYTADGQKNQVSTKFNVSVSSWSDFMIQISLPDFKIASIPEYSFQIKQVTLDMADNLMAKNFPTDYFASIHEYEDMPAAWKGVYIGKLGVVFPSKFKGQNANPEVALQNIIIDQGGISVNVSVKNLIPIETGNANGWAFSIDEFGIQLLRNTLMAGGINGKIRLPVSETPLRYKGIIDAKGTTQLSVVTPDTLAFEMWKAMKVNLLPGSSVALTYANEEFNASAELSGSMTIAADLSDDENGAVSMPGITFAGLRLSTSEPYLDVQSIGLTDAVSPAGFNLAGFSASIGQIGFVSEVKDGVRRVGLGLKVTVQLTRILNMSFGASGDFVVFGKMSGDAQNRQRWIYDEVDFKGLSVKVDNGLFYFAGGLKLFKNDPLYGCGFQADLRFELRKGAQFTASAVGVFGTRKTGSVSTPYWMVDVMTMFPNGGIPLGIVTLNGFGGGLSEGMRHEAKPTGSSSYGRSLSGMVYVPDSTMGLGIKASTNFIVKKAVQVAEGNVGLEFMFHTDGSLRSISLDGECVVLTALKIRASLGSLQGNTAAILKRINEKNDKVAAIARKKGVAPESVSGTEVLPDSTKPPEFTTVSGAITAVLHVQYLADSAIFHADLLTNINLRKLLTGGGKASMHFAPHEWYIRVGVPTDPVKTNLNIGAVQSSTVCYFMAGDHLPGLPPPPEEITRFLAVDQTENNFIRNDQALQNGSGVAAGFTMKASINPRFLIFSADLTAVTGLDINISRYDNVYCEGSDDLIGLDGWYASGQIYFYVNALIRVDIKVFKIQKRFDILHLSLGALLRAKLPSPFYAQGILAGQYSVLDGLVRGSCRFKFEIGTDCKKVYQDPENQQAADLEVITNLQPDNGTESVKVVEPIKAQFALPVESYFDIPDNNGQYIHYKALVDYSRTSVTRKSDSQPIPGTWSLSPDHRSMLYKSDVPLPAGTEIKTQVTLTFVDYLGNVVKGDDGQPGKEVKTVYFKTDTAALVTIPKENIAIAYPYLNQLNLYTQESSTGYIQLIKRQDDLFASGGKRLEFAGGGKTYAATNVSYANGKISYTLPDGLPLNTDFELHLLNADGSNVLSYGFRTSRFPSLSAKMSALFAQGFSASSDSSAIQSPAEAFDDGELYGGASLAGTPLLTLEADLNTYWYNTYYQEFYANPLASMPTRYDGFGSPPASAVRLDQIPKTILYSGNGAPSAQVMSIRYLLSRYIKKDIEGVNNNLSKIYKDDNPPFWTFVPMTSDEYPVKYRYTLPDGTPGKSTGSFIIHYFP